MRHINRIYGNRTLGYYKIISEMKLATEVCEAAALELFSDLEIIVGGPSLKNNPNQTSHA